MRAQPILILAIGVAALVGCQQAPSQAPAAPSTVSSTAVAMSTAEVPFHSEVAWTKTPGSDVSQCLRPAPAGKVYLARNTNTGIAVSSQLGEGPFVIHTCVYGTPGKPEGWLADISWTAANGDVLLATSDFQYWTGTPGQSVAVDTVKFQNGGTGRFTLAEGEGMCYVNAPAKTAIYDGTLRYSRK